jgi:DNA primase
MRGTDWSALCAKYENNISQAADWLEDRGLTMADAAMFRLGVVDDPSPESAPYRGRLAIPYLTRAGVVDIRFRTLHSAGPKYLSHPGAKPHLFNVAALWRNTHQVAIAEGESDAMVMDLYGGIPTVGVPGAQLWRKHFRHLFTDYDRVLVLGDGDDAGREFSRSIAASMDNAHPVPMPDGMDVCDLYRTAGVSALGRLVG